MEKYCIGIAKSQGALALLLLWFVFLPGQPLRAQETLDRHEYRQTHMGMPVRVVLHAPADAIARGAAQAAFHRISTLEQVFSSYRSSSELSRMNERAGTAPVQLSGPLFEVLERSQRLARQSNGAFDVTAGPYVALWRDARQSGELPDSSALQQAGARVGWKKIRLNAKRRTVHFRVDGMQVNLGGIAKGYILDRALDTLSAQGIDRAMIEAGGDLVVSGPPPGNEGWRVRLPGASSKGEARTLRLTHAAVSTSGNTHQYVDINGTRYSHVVNPKTGLGLTHHLLVTIVADTGITADGLSTTVGLLGAEDGPAFLSEHYPAVKSFIRPADTSRSAN